MGGIVFEDLARAARVADDEVTVLERSVRVLLRTVHSAETHEEVAEPGHAEEPTIRAAARKASRRVEDVREEESGLVAEQAVIADEDRRAGREVLEAVEGHRVNRLEGTDEPSRERHETVIDAVAEALCELHGPLELQRGHQGNHRNASTRRLRFCYRARP